MGTSSTNFFQAYDWDTMMKLNPVPQDPAAFYDIKKYHAILSPDYPKFLDRYLELPSLKRLAGVGLLCGTDWTKLYKNRFYYSRLDHSVGVALIIWHFTRDKAQTLAGLFHDISTPVFSHVSDFRKGDALTQTATEQDTKSLLHNDSELAELLAKDGLTAADIDDYHRYPVADNEIPQLSADRLEYMFPSGMALDGSWDLASIKTAYDDITVLKNEDGIDELGFKTLEIAEDYCRRFCMIGHILQLNENKLTLHMLGQIMNKAVELGVLNDSDFMTKSEREIMDTLDNMAQALRHRERSYEAGQKQSGGLFLASLRAAMLRRAQGPQDGQEELEKLIQLYKTFRTMTKIEHTATQLDPAEYFCVSLKVKQRYINPLVQTAEKPTAAKRLSELSPQAARIINDFLAYSDTKYGCVRMSLRK